MDFREIQDLMGEALAAMSWLELIAVLFGLAYVILAAEESIWCWPAALISVTLYIYLCVDARLYAETGLQIFYLIMAIVGWRSWNSRKYGPATREKPRNPEAVHVLPIKTWPVSLHLKILLLNAAATLLLAWGLSTYTSAANPLLDSFTTIFSLFTTWMVTQKVLENWLYWVVIDAASVFLYASRDLYLTALLFALYTLIAIAGFRKWYKQYQLQTPQAHKW